MEIVIRGSMLFKAFLSGLVVGGLLVLAAIFTLMVLPNKKP